jgi:hypothetical protein
MSIFGPSNPVFAMLKKDHAKVKELFEQFEAAKDSRTKERIVRETLLELDVHATLEETLIYPAIKREVDADDVMDEALEEHHVAHVLIDELKRMSTGDDRYEAKFTVLGENIKHHIKEEEGSMFSEAEKADVDWEGLEEKVIERKEALMAKHANGKQQSMKVGGGKVKAGSGRRQVHRQSRRAA